MTQFQATNADVSRRGGGKPLLLLFIAINDINDLYVYKLLYFTNDELKNKNKRNLAKSFPNDGEMDKEILKFILSRYHPSSLQLISRQTKVISQIGYYPESRKKILREKLSTIVDRKKCFHKIYAMSVKNNQVIRYDHLSKKIIVDVKPKK